MMNKQNIIKKLEDLGFEQDEALVYIYLLENGPKTMLEISRDTEINRSKLYRVSEKMKKMKIVEESSTAWGKKLKASNPENLELVIKTEQELLDKKKSLVPGLITSLNNFSSTQSSQFEIKNYHGIDGLKQLIWNELKEKEVLIFGYQTMNEIVGQKFADYHREESIKRGRKNFEIANSEKVHNEKEYTKHDKEWVKIFRYRYIPKDILTITQSITVYGNNVSVINWIDGERVGVEIRNKDFAQMQRQIFWHYWELGKS